MKKRVALAVLVGAGLVAGAVGCGGGGSSKSAASASPSTSTSAGDNGVAKLTPREIVDKSVQALKDGGSAHVTGTTTANGQLTTLDLALDTATNCVGTVGQASQGTFQLVKVGKQIWLKPDQAFWQTHGGPATAQLVGDKYLKTTSDNPDFTDLTSVCDLGGIADSIAKGPDTVAPGSTTTVNGTSAVTVIGTKGTETGTLYVATTGRPYMLRVEKSGGTDATKLDFKDFGVPVPTTTPSPDQSIDLDQLNRETATMSPTPSAAAV